MALQKALALTVVGVAAGVAGFLASSGRSRAEEGGHLDWHGSDTTSSCGGTGSCGTECSCGTAVRGDGL
ncbi:hypothetical protein [Streptomyces sp. NPDC006463]|uniref:hypothetical protein n=1 Tax=Streptomyces sp. NPDC006463 TaxID=3364746 RepID=UPI003691FE45